MSGKNRNLSLTAYDELFQTAEERQESSQERIQMLPLELFHPFPEHPFQVRDDEKMENTARSIAQFGVLVPILARPRPEGGYEIVSGHRRHHASQLADLKEIPAIIRNMDDDEATIVMVDSNLQREQILPSEKAFAYKMKLDALKHQGQKTLDQIGPKWSTQEIGKASNDNVYTLKETKAPEGFLLDNTVYTLKTSYEYYSKAVNSITLTVSDQPITGQIQLEKWAVNTVSGEKQLEQGAVFEVYLKSAGSYTKAADDVKDLITTNEDGTATTKALPYGIYCVRQSLGQTGYSLDETVYEVSITEDGKIVAVDTAGKELVLYNDIWTGTLTVLKVDADSREPLAGAEFTLTGSDDSEIVLETDSEGKVTFENLIYGVEYTWTETAAPKGYLLSEGNTGTVSVEEADAVIEVTAEDERRPGSITVTKQNTDGDPLFDCTFLLEYLDGDTWKPVFQSEDLVVGGCSSEGLSEGCLTTDESGTVTFSGLWADGEVQYRLTEVAAPEG